MTRTTYLILCALGALALATVASGAASETGVTSTQVLIGGTTPLSGPASAYQSVAKGAAAYFRYVNANGGVNKRKIKYVYKDDAYDPSKTADKTRELVQQDKVFAIFNSLGTEQNLATRAYLNALKMPQLFVASGATTFGKDYKQYPWTIGYQPNYRAEGTIYGRYVAKTGGKARIGVLYQNDDYGKDLLAGLRNGLGKKAKLIVSKQSYDVDRPGRAVAGRPAEGGQGEHADGVRDAALHDPVVRLRAQARLEAEGLRERRLERGQHHGPRQGGRRPEADRGHDLDRLPQGPDRRALGEGSGREALPLDHEEVQGRQPERRLRGLRDVGRAHLRRGAEEGRQEPDSRRDHEGGDEPERHERPVPAPGDHGQDERLADHFPLDQSKLQRYHNGHWVSFGGLFRVR